MTRKMLQKRTISCPATPSKRLLPETVTSTPTKGLLLWGYWRSSGATKPASTSDLFVTRAEDESVRKVAIRLRRVDAGLALVQDVSSTRAAKKSSLMGMSPAVFKVQ